MKSARAAAIFNSFLKSVCVEQASTHTHKGGNSAHPHTPAARILPCRRPLSRCAIVQPEMGGKKNGKAPNDEGSTAARRPNGWIPSRRQRKSSMKWLMFTSISVLMAMAIAHTLVRLSKLPSWNLRRM